MQTPPVQSPHISAGKEHFGGRPQGGLQPQQAVKVVYGASPAWPLAHLPNAAAHGPASTALGDSWKAAHHHGGGAQSGRPAKLLLAGEAAACQTCACGLACSCAGFLGRKAM